MSKYTPLAAHLLAQNGDRVRLSFAQIERVLGDILPNAAYDHPAWWANSRTQDSHTWAHLWLAAGWEKAQLNLAEQWVVFRRFQLFAIESERAREGYEVDRRILAPARNAQVAIARKEQDDFTCQACGFRLQLQDRFVIEVHHLYPLAATGEVETSLTDLASLCPTCHRISHLKSPPFEIAEIRDIRAGRAMRPIHSLSEGP